MQALIENGGLQLQLEQSGHLTGVWFAERWIKGTSVVGSVLLMQLLLNTIQGLAINDIPRAVCCHI